MTTETEEVGITNDQQFELHIVERALAEADAARAALLRDGRPLYAPDEHQRREQAIEERLQGVIERASETADEAVSAAAVTLERLTDTDPLNALTVQEQEAANRRAVFVKEDAERLSLGDLTRRVRQALAGSDRAMLYLWARYADVRLQVEQADGRVGPADVDAVRALSEALKDAAGRFVDTSAVTSAERKLTVAREFRRRVFETRRPLLVEQAMAELRAQSSDGF